MEKIVSKDNKFFKKIKKLKLKKYREIDKLFIAEGHKFLDFKVEPYCILIDEDNQKYIEKVNNFNCKKYILTKQLFSEVTSQENSQGIIVVYDFVEENISFEDNIVILDRVQDPGNLGTIIRVADAAGYKDIILTKGSADIYNEKTVRSSMGSIFNMNFLYMEEKEMHTFLRKNNYRIIVTALTDKAKDYCSVTLDKKNAVVFGNEGQGASNFLIENSDEQIIIPIFGSAESLNVAMASGIILYKLRELFN